MSARAPTSWEASSLTICFGRLVLPHLGPERQRRLLDYESEFDSLVFGETPRSPSERFLRRKMAHAQDIAFLHRALPHGALPTMKRATERERAIAARRFWRSDIFLRAYTNCHRGMLYSLLIHFALLSLLIASPAPIPESVATAESYLMPLDSPSDSPAPVSAPVATGHEHLPPCWRPAPNGNASDLLRATNNSLQSAQAHEPYPNDPSAGSPQSSFAREFHSPAEHAHIPTCFSVFERGTSAQILPSNPLQCPRPPRPSPMENKTRNEPFKTAAIVPMTRTARATLSSSACSPLRPTKRSPHPVPNPAAASPKTPLPAYQPIPPQVNPHPPAMPRTPRKCFSPASPYKAENGRRIRIRLSPQSARRPAKNHIALLTRSPSPPPEIVAAASGILDSSEARAFSPIIST